MPGQIRTITLESGAPGPARQVHLYLPPGYDSAEERYPALYLLRGHEREWLNPTEDPHRQGRTAATISDQLIESGELPPLILVMPGLESAEYLAGEVVPEIDRRFRTRADRQSRGIDGFSLGGLAALSFALRRPELFASVGAFDATILWAGGQRPDGTEDSLASHPFVTPILGGPGDAELLRRTSPADLVQTLPQATLQSLRFHIHAAPEAMEPQAANFYRTRHFMALLGARGVTNSWSDFVLPGSQHNWFWADEHLKRSLLQHAAVFVGGKKKLA